MTKQVQQLDHVIIRFAGDSGDGMQLAGDRFTQETAIFGNDLSTQPNFPAEIRAPAGTLAGVSSFQLHFADHDILTPGDAPDVLIAMNPAALKANISDLPRGGDLIVNTDEFTKRNLTKVGYQVSPLEDGSLEQYNVHAVPITSMTVKALESFDITRKDAERAKNMFALGMLSWLYDRPADGTLSFLKAKFASKPEIMAANVAAFGAGWNFGETTEAFPARYEVKPAPLAPGTYRNISGNTALAYGLHRGLPAGRAAAVPRLLPDHAGLGHPARAGQAQALRGPDVPGRGRDRRRGRGPGRLVRRLAERDQHVRTRDAAQGRDCRPGRIGRAAPDRLRHPAGRAVHRDADQDRADRPAAGHVRPQRRVAGAHRRPRQPRRLLQRRDRGGPDRGQVPDPGDPALRRLPGQRLRAVADPGHRQPARPERRVLLRAEPADPADPAGPGEHSGGFEPFRRDPVTLARPWAIPGTAGLEHRIGGIEKADITGEISYDPDNHDRMVRLRQAKIDGIAADIAPLAVDDPGGSARVLVLGWGSTYGAIGAAVRRVRNAGHAVAQAHLRHLNPFPPNLGEVLRRYDKVLLPEINLGQLALLLRGRYLVDVISYNRVRGLPFQAAELAGVIEDVIGHA